MNIVDRSRIKANSVDKRDDPCSHMLDGPHNEPSGLFLKPIEGAFHMIWPTGLVIWPRKGLISVASLEL